MDLYMQIGFILILLTAFSSLIYFTFDAIDRGEQVYNTFAKEGENYSLDSSVTNPMFYVDARTFTQWALNAKSQRDLYLVYPNTIIPDNSIYKQHLRKLDVTLDVLNPSDRKIVLNPNLDSNVNNAYFVNDQSPKTVDYLYLYSEEAKRLSRDKVITVYTFSEDTTDKTIYLAYIK